MLRSMFSAISGLRAHQTKMDVTGNNIANVNTAGFKASQTVFQDTLSQVIRAGGAPAADRGGTNPAQVGLGVKVAAITTNFTQGATQTTGRSTDLMIQGDGFFVTRDGTENCTPGPARSTSTATASWSRPNGGVLQGWMADAAGVVNSNGPTGDLRCPTARSSAPSRPPPARSAATSPPGRPPATTFQTGVTMYDSQGVAQKVFYNFTKAAAANTWTLDIEHDDGTASSPAPRSRSTPPAR